MQDGMDGGGGEDDSYSTGAAATVYRECDTLPAGSMHIVLRDCQGRRVNSGSCLPRRYRVLRTACAY